MYFHSLTKAIHKARSNRTGFFHSQYLDLVIACIAFLFFLYHRSQRFTGDGFLISRITEGGKWFVKNEMLSQALIQFIYMLFSPFHWTPMEAMNLLSCIAGALSLFILLRMNRRFGVENPLWILLIFFSSGFFVFSCGHTEYYPMVLPAMILYGFMALRYLEDKSRILYVTVIFVTAVSLHFAMLIATPSLVLLPLLKGKIRDYREMIFGTLLILPIILMRNFPNVVGFRAASLSPSINFLPWFYEEGMYRYYAFFQWEHVWDWIYAWTMRSWVFWPFIFLVFTREGWKQLLHPKNLFFLFYVLPFTLWSMVWHPDLGMQKDWDLFALEAVPCMLWLMTLLPKFRMRYFDQTLLIFALISSIFITYNHVRDFMNPPREGFGAAQILIKPKESSFLKVNGFYRDGNLPRLRKGIYQGKMIQLELKTVYDFYFYVIPQEETRIKINFQQQFY